MTSSKLVPELEVTDLDASLVFYVEHLGFEIKHERPEERFAFLVREGAELMMEEATGPGRRLNDAPLEHPFGRGVGFQIEVSDVDALYRRVLDAGCKLKVPMEERWYRMDDVEGGNRQFWLPDPDGYLLRFFQDLGKRPLAQMTARVDE